MNLNNIPVDELVVIDANIILYAAQQLSPQCKRLLYRCADNDVKGVLPAHILAEIMHQLMIAEARDNGWIQGTNPAKQLTRNPDIVKKLFRYEEVLRDILAIGLQIEPLQSEDFITALDIQHRFGLLTNDALLVAVARRLRTKSIVSADKIFSQVQGFLVYAPDDLNEL